MTQRAFCPACQRTTAQHDRTCRRCSELARRRVCQACGRTDRADVVRRDGTGWLACERCRRRAAAARLQADDLAAIISLLAASQPGLPPELVAVAVGQAATTRWERPRLLAWLREHPDALASGAPAPLVVARLVTALRSAGATGVTSPRCAVCGRAVRLRRRLAGQHVCARCAVDAHPTVCASCGRQGRVAARTQTGQPRCPRCQSAQRTAACASCGRHRRIAGHTTSGRPRCSSCCRRDQATWKVCGACGQRRAVNARGPDGRARCANCYRRDQQPRHRCTGCGHQAPITSRRDGRALCERCYQRPRRPCGGCGRRRQVALRATDTTPDLCGTCYQAPVVTCSSCHRDRLGRRTGAAGRPICFGCRLQQRLDQLLTSPDQATIPAALTRVRDAILAADNPRSALNWLASSPAAVVLGDLAAGRLALTHQALDELPRGYALDHLRQLLVAAGALPDRDPYLARLEPLLHDHARRLEHPDDARLLRAWARWDLLWRLRRKASQGKPMLHRARNARASILEVTGLLRWLRQHDTSPAACTQADLDTWHRHRGPGSRWARGFLLWASRRRYLPAGLQLPPAPARPELQPLAADDRWRLARRLLHDDQLPPGDRVAGLLVLLYGQPLTRIARLTTNDVDRDRDQTRVTLGTDSLQLHDPLAGLIRVLPTQPSVGTAGRLAPATWLFPGRQPNQPIHPDQLSRRLHALGLQARPGRTATLLQLASQLPAKVIADLLGLHVTTANRWVKAAAGDWSRYAAERSRTPPPPSP